MLTSMQRRGKSGGQVRDEYRDEEDPGRPAARIAAERRKEEDEYGKGR